MDIPTKESHNGWANSLIFKVKGVEFTMLPVEEVKISGDVETHSLYFLAETETTQKLYYAIMGGSTSYPNRPKETYASYYSDNASWVSFISNLNSLTGLKFRFPTEEEWQFAAKGGMNTQGYTYSGSNNIDDVAWYSSNSSSTLHDVKQLQPNELGFYDMSGNANEIIYPGSGSYYFAIGGSYTLTAGYCTCSFGYNEEVYHTSSSTYGLRLALSFN